jgi:hypothetical protein
MTTTPSARSREGERLVWSSTQLALVASLAALIGAVSARAWPVRGRSSADRAIREIRERLDALEGRVAPEPARPPSHPLGPRRLPRRDPALISPTTPKLIAVPDLSANSESDSDSTRDLRRKYRDIWAWADAGLDAEAIARSSGLPIGQVELILGLRRFDPGSPGTRPV